MKKELLTPPGFCRTISPTWELSLISESHATAPVLETPSALAGEIVESALICIDAEGSLWFVTFTHFSGAGDPARSAVAARLKLSRTLNWFPGGGGGATVVVKLHAAENALGPPAFFASTRQKYFVPLESGPTCREVTASVESSTTVDPKSESVDSCTRYVVAPADAFQLSVNVVD